jgi:hypothetical protein
MVDLNDRLLEGCRKSARFATRLLMLMLMLMLLLLLLLLLQLLMLLLPLVQQLLLLFLLLLNTPLERDRWRPASAIHLDCRPRPLLHEHPRRSLVADLVHRLAVVGIEERGVPTNVAVTWRPPNGKVGVIAAQEEEVGDVLLHANVVQLLLFVMQPWISYIINAREDRWHSFLS